MNNSPQISIIVPVYNAQKYLSQCIDSILAQNFTDFEVLLIDDGSKDQSNLICNQYAQKDKRIKVFHKQNGGVSSARNLGIDKARGKFIVFIDSDDYIDSCYLSILTSVEADIVITGYSPFGNGDCSKCLELTDSLYSNKQIANCLSTILDKLLMRTPWGKLYNLKIIKENSLYFNQHMRIAEDTVFIQTYLLHCKTIAIRNGIPYHYRTSPNEDSALKYNLSSDEYLYTLNEIIKAYIAISQKFNFTCISYYKMITRYMLLLYWRKVASKGCTLKGYRDYKDTMLKTCPEVHFQDTFYSSIYKFIQKKKFFLSYLILTLFYPLRTYIRK